MLLQTLDGAVQLARTDLVVDIHEIWRERARKVHHQGPYASFTSTQWAAECAITLVNFFLTPALASSCSRGLISKQAKSQRVKPSSKKGKHWFCCFVRLEVQSQDFLYAGQALFHRARPPAPPTHTCVLLWFVFVVPSFIVVLCVWGVRCTYRCVLFSGDLSLAPSTYGRWLTSTYNSCSRI